METQNLLSAIFTNDKRLDRSGFDGVDAVQFVAFAKKEVITVVGLGSGNNFIQTGNVLVVESHGQTKTGKAAVFAGYLDFTESNDLLIGH